METTSRIYTEKELEQIEMFSCTTEQIREEFNEARNGKIYLMSILSDVQELTSLNPKVSNMLLNKAKYIIDQLM